MTIMAQDTTLALMQTAQAGMQNAVDKVEAAEGIIDLEKAEETAREFEAVFITEMIRPMFEGISTDGAFGGGKGEEIFRGMLLSEYGTIMSQTGSIGLADHVKDTMIRMQIEASGIDPLSTEYQEILTALTNGESDAKGVE